MTLEDVEEWISNRDWGNNPSIAIRVDDYIRSAANQPKAFQIQVLGGLLSKDRDAYALIAKNKPEWRKELQKAVYGRQWDWGQDQVAQLLGFDPNKPVEMFKRDENGNPAWHRLIGNEDDPSKALDKFYAEEEGLKTDGKLYKWLQSAQAQYDNQDKYTGGAVNATRGLFAPRTQESLVRSGDYTWKDVLGDVGENIVQAFPWSRGAADVGKVLTGTKALGRFAKPVHSAEMLASNAAAPLWGEAYDAMAYNDFENPYRSRFNAGDVLSGTATNITTAPILGGMASQASRLAGVDGVSRRGVREFLSSDPYATTVHKMTELKSNAPFRTKYSPSQLDLEGEVYTKVFGYPARKVKAAGKAQREAWERNLGLNKLQTGDLETDYGLIKQLMADPETPRENIPVLENIKEKMETFRLMGGNRGQMAYDSYLLNREHMTPTAILEAQGLGNKYGAADNNIADVAFFANNPAEQHGITPVVKPNKSATSLKKAEMAKSGVDKTYPVVETDFDRLAYELENKPEVVNYYNKGRFVKPVVVGYTTNKLGKQEYGEKLTGKNLNLSSMDEDVAAILNNETTLRMWESGFVPHGNPEEPMMKAYAIYKTNKEKGISPKLGKNAGL